MELKNNTEIYRSKLYMLTKENDWIEKSIGIPYIEKSLVNHKGSKII